MTQEICVDNIIKRYDDKLVLNRVSFHIARGSRICLMGPSGVGKTTFFRVLLGLEKMDGGSISGLENCRFGVLFQEDRLLEELTAVENVFLTAGKGVTKADLHSLLLKILPLEALDKPAGKLSGGMKRRVALARALLSPSDLLILDEPFTGLDEETKCQVIAWIRKMQGERTLLFSSHQEDDAYQMDARIIRIS